MKRRPAKRSYTRHPVPVVALDRAREAGASVLAWYQTELLKRTDPTGRWLRLGTLLDSVTAWFVPAFVVTVCAAKGAWVAVFLAAAVLLWGLARRAFARNATWALAVSSVVVAFSIPGAWGTWPTFSIVLGCAVVWLAVLRANRGAVWTLILCAVTVVLAVSGGPGVAANVVGVVIVAVGLIVDYVLSPVPLWQRRYTVKPDIVDAPLGGAVHVNAPWLTRVMALRASHQEDYPELAKKRAGAWGELRTGLLLLALRRGKGTLIAHDILIPGADEANLDHLVIARSGWYGLDSKQFGTKQDPGVVVLDETTGQLQHRSQAGVRDVSGSVRTLVWACRQVETVALSATPPGGVLGVLVIHGADVAPGIVVPGGDGRYVEVIPAAKLLSRIDGAAPVLSRSELEKSRLSVRAFRSATNGGAPELVSPMGSRWRRVEPWTAQAAHRAGSTLPPEPQQQYPREPSTDTMPIPVRSQPEPVVHDTQPIEVMRPAESDGWNVESQPVSTSAGQTWLPQADIIPERWEQMLAAPAAAPDDLPVEQRGIVRGEMVTHFVMVEEPADVHVEDVVALREPCEGISGPYLWVCTPADWERHVSTGSPVYANTVPLASVLRRTP